MMVNGKTIKWKGLVSFNGQMGLNTKVNSFKINLMVKVNTFGPMVKYI
jgi:hypothetical protein